MVSGWDSSISGSSFTITYSFSKKSASAYKASEINFLTFNVISADDSYVPKTSVTVNSQAITAGRFDWSGVSVFGATAGWIQYLVLPKNQKGPSTGLELYQWSGNTRRLQVSDDTNDNTEDSDSTSGDGTTGDDTNGDDTPAEEEKYGWSTYETEINQKRSDHKRFYYFKSE